MVKYERRRITTEDEDFLDLDCLLTGNSRLAILCHGLGGSSEAPYMKSTAEEFQRRDFDVVAMNYRSCSEEVNRKAKMYGMMTYLDLETVVKAFEEEY
ncbi:putative hydrolase [Fusobacterium necrophorum subsp. necrophorum]|nr:putative hydrolase [Fusobacterium necrophorum subsp. necrophorum]